MDGALGNIIATNEPIRRARHRLRRRHRTGRRSAVDGGRRHLLFNDIHTARRMKYTPGQNGATVAMEKTNEANGITRDLQGRLLSAEHLTRRVTRYEADGSVTVSPTASGQAPAAAERRDRQIRRHHLFHRSGRHCRSRPVGRDRLRRLSRLGRSRHDVAHHRRHGPAERPRLLARREHPLRRRLAPPSCPRLRHAAQRHRLPSRRAASSSIWAAPSPACPTASKSTLQGNIYTGGAGGLYIIDKPARSSAASSTATPRRPTWPSAATIGRRSTSPRAVRSSRST